MTKKIALAPVAPSFADIALGTLSGTLMAVTSPLRMMRAAEKLNKFRALDDAALMDMGITREQAEAATLEDFLNQPQKRH